MLEHKPTKAKLARSRNCQIKHRCQISLIAPLLNRYQIKQSKLTSSIVKMFIKLLFLVFSE